MINFTIEYCSSVQYEFLYQYEAEKRSHMVTVVISFRPVTHLFEQTEKGNLFLVSTDSTSLVLNLKQMSNAQKKFTRLSNVQDKQRAFDPWQKGSNPKRSQTKQHHRELYIHSYLTAPIKYPSTLKSIPCGGPKVMRGLCNTC